MPGLEVEVKLKDLEVFQSLLNVIAGIVSDERIPEDVRLDYKDKILSITGSSDG